MNLNDRINQSIQNIKNSYGAEVDTILTNRLINNFNISEEDPNFTTTLNAMKDSINEINHVLIEKISSEIITVISNLSLNTNTVVTNVIQDIFTKDIAIIQENVNVNKTFN